MQTLLIIVMVQIFFLESTIFHCLYTIEMSLFTVATTLSTLLHIDQGIHSEENHMISTKGKDGAWFLIQKKDHSSKCNDM